MMTVDLKTAKRLALVRQLKWRVAQAKLLRATRELLESERQLKEGKAHQAKMIYVQRSEERVFRSKPVADQDFQRLGNMHLQHDADERIIARKLVQLKKHTVEAQRVSDAALKLVAQAERGRERSLEVTRWAKEGLAQRNEAKNADMADELAGRRGVNPCPGV